MAANYYDANQGGGYAGASNYEEGQDEEEGENEEWEEDEGRNNRKGNVLPFWGNQNSMNLNPLIVTNIQNSPYFKVNLLEIKTYHEVIDEIYYKVAHLEPWERGSRKTSGQTGMCGGVRGVGAGGIVSSAFCLLYKLSTLKLTRKQVNGLMNHADSPYIRGLGFMYVRFTQPPADLLEWFEDYLDDEEMIDVKAGGGKEISIGEMCKQFLTKLEWFDTRFPRIPVNVQKEIEDYFEQRKKYMVGHDDEEDVAKNESRKGDNRIRDRDNRSRDGDNPSRDRDRDRKDRRDRDDRRRDKDRDRHRDRDRDRKRNDDRHKRRSRSRDRERDRDRDRGRHHGRNEDYQNELKKYSDHRKKEKKHKRSRSRSRSRDRRY